MMSKKLIITLSVIVAVALLFSNVGLWLERQIFAKNNFQSTAVRVIKTAPVRAAVADEIITSVTGGIPALNKVAKGFLKPPLTDFLNTNVVRSVVVNLAGQIQTALTSPQSQSVAIDISAITTPVKTIAKFVPNLSNSIKQGIKQMPSSIVLIKKGVIPSIFTAGLILMWLGRLSGLTALVIIGIMVWQSVKYRQSLIIRTLGINIAIGAAAFLALIWAFANPMLNTLGNGNIKIIISNIFAAFINILVNQTWGILIAGLIIIVAGYALKWWREAEETETGVEPEPARLKKAA